MGSEFISIQTDMKEIQSLISRLDLTERRVQDGMRSVLHEAADVVTAEQKRLIAAEVPALEKHIRAGDIYVTKKGVYGVKCGYLPSEGEKWVTVGAVFEFGRPGTSARHNSPDMKQTRRIYQGTRPHRRREETADGIAKTEITVKKGRIQPVPHIRRGFQNKRSEVVELMLRRLREIERGGTGT